MQTSDELREGFLAFFESKVRPVLVKHCYSCHSDEARKSKKLKGSTDYSSLSVGELGRVKQYLVMTDKSVAGVLANSGAILWEGDFPGDRAVVRS